jgi:glycosyltransferase involved in cell wall biosynthesis
MIIGIDGNEANIQNRVGVGQYAFNLLQKISSLDKKNKYIIYLKNPPFPDLPGQSPNWQYRVFGPKKLWTRFALPLRLFTQKEKLNLFFSPSHYTPKICPCPIVLTIHDLGYLQYQDQFTQKDLYQLIHWTKESLKKAAQIVTVSNFSKNEIEKIYKIDPKKITVVYNGVDTPPKIDLKTQQKILSDYNLKSKNYYLYLGTLKPNKNIPFLIKSFSQFLKKTKKTDTLVIAGKKGWLFNEIFDCVKKEGIEKNIVFTDYVSETQKWVLNQNAKSLILPSFYEGFGIPVIETMKVNTPVISSNIAPLQEVIETNGFYFNPTNQDELVDQLIKFEKINPSDLKKITDKAKIRADFFSWENTAKSVLQVFEKFNI